MAPIHWFREPFLLPLFCLAFVACADDPIRPEPEPTPVAEVRFAVDDSLGLYAGESIALGAAPYDAAGAVISDAQIEWAISDPDVVGVDSTGALKALAQGTASVTATVDSMSATVTVRVTDFVQISSKFDPLCARDAEGAVWCLGTEHPGRPVWGVQYPVYRTWRQVSGPLVFSDLTSGSLHTCGIAGAAYCWGSNWHGQLGNSDVSSSTAEPVPVGEQQVFVEMDGGWEHTCALDADRIAWCWGRSFEYQLGHGYSGYSFFPVPVQGGHTWRTIEAAGRTTCGVAEDGVTYCWGEMLDQDTIMTLPTAVAGVPAGLEILRVQWQEACGSMGAAVYCWGAGGPDPAQVTMPDDVVDLTMSDHSACAVLASGDIYCWGSNEDSLLGNASVSSSATPIPVAGDRKYVAITGEALLHCALAADGGVYCWGSGSPYRPGVPVPASSEPARVPAPMP